MRKITILGTIIALGLIMTSVNASAACRVKNGRIEVSPSGSCSSIQEAINAAPGTAEQPVVIDVMPGTYVQPTIMFAKSYRYRQLFSVNSHKGFILNGLQGS